MVNGVKFDSSLDKSRKSFNRAANAVLGKLLGNAPEELILHLLKIKALPILLYGTEALDVSNSSIRALDFCVVRFGCRIFRTYDHRLARKCLSFMGFALPSECIVKRVARFRARFSLLDNPFCVSLFV